MRDFSQEEIDNYPILKELEPYTDNSIICDNISEDSLKNLKDLITRNLIEIDFLTPETLDDTYSIVLEIALDDYDGGAKDRYINVSKELFEKLLTIFNN